MSLDDWYFVFVSVCLVLILTACIPVIMAFTPSREEPFFALAILGEEGMAEHYYPGDDPNIIVGQLVRWNIFIYNHMGEAQYVAVQVKLLNSTMSAPNSTTCTPSPAPVVFEARRIALDNETLLLPFSWSITEVEQEGNFLNVNSISVNDETVDIHAVAGYGCDYRLVLELWVYDKDLGDFQFGWGYRDERSCTWNQVWFNVISS
jgi:hypothetical protein